jgi:MerR family copper efflux transcriptional regulator
VVTQRDHLSQLDLSLGCQVYRRAVERTVKQVAARVGLPERTVRYYDHIGLVASSARSGAGYRLYGPEEEGKLSFVHQAKSLGFSLDDVRSLIAAAERGCCGEVVPELQRMLDRKVVEIEVKLAELATFRDRLVAFRAGQHAGCACGEHGAFCGCLDGASSPGMQPVPSEGRTILMDETTHTATIQSCGCGCNAAGGGGCGCGCDGSCGCGISASEASAGHEQTAELKAAKRQTDRQLTDLHRS